MDPAFAAGISLLTAVAVAYLTHLLSTRRKREDELYALRVSAYADFIAAASHVISARRLGMKTDTPADLARLNDAKIRICLTAPPQVVEALAEFWGEGGTLEQEREVLTFTRLVEAIRTSLSGKPRDIAAVDTSSVLFRIEPSAFSFRAYHKPESVENLLAEARRLDGEA